MSIFFRMAFCHNILNAKSLCSAIVNYLKFMHQLDIESNAAQFVEQTVSFWSLVVRREREREREREMYRWTQKQALLIGGLSWCSADLSLMYIYLDQQYISPTQRSICVHNWYTLLLVNEKAFSLEAHVHVLVKKWWSVMIPYVLVSLRHGDS